MFLDLNFPAFNSAHIQNVIDQAQQMVAGREHFLQRVPYLVFVVNMTHRNGCKPNNRIHGRADVVRHIRQKRSLRLVGVLRLHQSILQRLGDMHFFLFYLCNVLANKKDFVNLSLITFQTYDVHMLPFIPVIAEHMGFKTQVILPLHRLNH